MTSRENKLVFNVLIDVKGHWRMEHIIYWNNQFLKTSPSLSLGKIMICHSLLIENSEDKPKLHWKEDSFDSFGMIQYNRSKSSLEQS